MDNKNEIFKGTLDDLNKIQPDVFIVSVKSWKNTDKYPCPKCNKKIGMPSYTCEDCNIKLKPVMNF